MPKLVTQFDHDDQGTPLAPLVCSFLTYGQIGVGYTFVCSLLVRKVSLPPYDEGGGLRQQGGGRET